MGFISRTALLQALTTSSGRVSLRLGTPHPPAVGDSQNLLTYLLRSWYYCVWYSGEHRRNGWRAFFFPRRSIWSESLECSATKSIQGKESSPRRPGLANISSDDMAGLQVHATT